MPIFDETDIKYCDQLIKDGYVIVSYGTSANVEGGNAERFPSSGLSDYQPLPLQHYMFNKSESVTITLEYGVPHAVVHLLQPGKIIAVASDAMTSTVDTVKADLSSWHLNLTANTPVTRTISSVTNNQRVDLSNLRMDEGEVLMTSFGDGQLQVSSSSGLGKYTLHFLNKGIASTVNYTVTMPIIERDDTHFVQPTLTADFVTVSIDSGSDGTIDETINVKPTDTETTDNQIFLPLVAR